MRKFTAVDLFAGAGGLSYGFKKGVIVNIVKINILLNDIPSREQKTKDKIHELLPSPVSLEEKIESLLKAKIENRNNFLQSLQNSLNHISSAVGG